MNYRFYIGAIIVAVTALAAAQAQSFGLPSGGHFSLSSYGPGFNPFSSDSVTSVSYRQPGFSGGFFRDSPGGVSFGGVSSRDFSGGYAYNKGFSYANVRSTQVSGSIYRTAQPGVYGGSVNYGRGAVDNYRYNRPTVYGNAYGAPYGYDRMGRSW